MTGNLFLKLAKQERLGLEDPGVSLRSWKFEPAEMMTAPPNPPWIRQSFFSWAASLAVCEGLVCFDEPVVLCGFCILWPEKSSVQCRTEPDIQMMGNLYLKLTKREHLALVDAGKSMMRGRISLRR